MGFRCVRCSTDWNKVGSCVTVKLHSDSDASEDMDEPYIYTNNHVYVKFDWQIPRRLDFMWVFLVAIKKNLICDAGQYNEIWAFTDLDLIHWHSRGFVHNLNCTSLNHGGGWFPNMCPAYRCCLRYWGDLASVQSVSMQFTHWLRELSNTDSSG